MEASSSTELSDSSTPDTLSPVPPAPANTCEIPLANLEGATGSFSGERIDYTLACTATENRACQIVYQLSTWNEMFFQAGIEVRETPRTQGGLTVTSIWNTHDTDHRPETLHRAFTLLHFLVKNHGCVRALDLTIGREMPHQALLCQAIRNSDNIESLKLGDFTPTSLVYCRFFATLWSLKNLKIFQCGKDKLPQPCLDGLTALLRTTMTLESLHILCRWATGGDPTKFFTALSAYSALKHLSLDLEILDHVSIECCEMFARYLKNTTALVELSFIWGCNADVNSRKMILRGICANKSILKLEMEAVSVDEEAVEIIATLFARNKHMRTFKISPYSLFFFFEPARYCDSWLRALRENDAIEELNLPYNIWRPLQWRMFFGILLMKKSLKMVTIGWTGLETTHFRQLCKELCESGVERKVHFHPAVNPSCFHDVKIFQCTSFVSIYASSTSSGNTDAPQLLRLVRELPLLHHVKELSLSIDPHTTNKDLSCAIADYIATTMTLKDLALEFYANPRLGEDRNICWKTIFEALSVNQSIAQLGIMTTYMDEEDMKRLSQVIRRSENVRVLFYKAGGPSNVFLKHLSKGIDRNYSLVTVHLNAPLDKHAFPVWDTARRNSSLVARASQFRHGAQLERFSAGALERVYRHRGLLEEFADLESISFLEAAAAVKAALRTFDDMNSFMRLAGVVRTSVECYPRQDGRAQLDDLNRLCWEALRRYLLLEDVVTRLPHA